MFSEIIQGVGTGLGILAVSTGLIYAASLGGHVLLVETSGGVVSVSAPISRDEVEIGEAPAESDDDVQLSAIDPPAPAPAAPEPDAFSTELRQIYYGLVAPELSLLSVSLKQAHQLFAYARPTENGWLADLKTTRQLAEEGHRQLLRSAPPTEALEMHQALLDESARCLATLDAVGDDPGSIPTGIFAILGDELMVCSESVVAIQEAISRLPRAEDG